MSEHALSLLVIGNSRLSLRCHGTGRVARHRSNELNTSKPERGPVIVDRNLAHSLESEVANHLPTSVPIEIAPISLRTRLGVCKPHDSVPEHLLRNGCRHLVYFELSHHERENEGDLLNIIRVSYDLNSAESRKFGLKTCRCVEHKYFCLVLEIELSE